MEKREEIKSNVATNQRSEILDDKTKTTWQTKLEQSLEFIQSVLKKEALPRLVREEDFIDAVWTIIIATESKKSGSSFSWSKLDSQYGAENGTSLAKIHQLFSYGSPYSHSQVLTELKAMTLPELSKTVRDALKANTISAWREHFNSCPKEAVTPENVTRNMTKLLEFAAHVAHALQNEQDPGGTIYDARHITFLCKLAFLKKHEGDIKSAGKSLHFKSWDILFGGLKHLVGMEDPLQCLIDATISDVTSAQLKQLTDQEQATFSGAYRDAIEARKKPGEEKQLPSFSTSSLPRSIYGAIYGSEVRALLNAASNRITGLLSGTKPEGYSSTQLEEDVILVGTALIPFQRTNVSLSFIIGENQIDSARFAAQLEMFLKKRSLSTTILTDCAPIYSDILPPQAPHLATLKVKLQSLRK